MALRKVWSDVFSSSTKGSFTGYLSEPHSTECSRTWNTPVESSGRVLKAMENALFSSARSSQQSSAPVFFVGHLPQAPLQLRQLPNPLDFKSVYVCFRPHIRHLLYVFLLILHHQSDDLLVRLLHAKAGQATHAGDGIKITDCPGAGRSKPGACTTCGCRF